MPVFLNTATQRICGIYAIRHRASGKEYIGRSVNVFGRWAGHKHDAFKRGRTNPLHSALRKYGADAFDWLVLAEVPELELVDAEARYILARGTLAPAGYNIGGTAGGFPSKALIEAMAPEQRTAWLATMRRVSKTGAAGLAAKRADPAYEQHYRAAKSAASRKRESNIRARVASDPAYAAKESARRRNAALKNHRHDPKASAATFRARMLADPIFAEQVRANRAEAGRKSHEKRKKAKEATHASLA